AGVVLVVQFLIDFESRLGEIRDEVAQVNELTELHAKAKTSPIRTELALDILRKAPQIRPDPPVLSEFLNGELRRANSLFESWTSTNEATYIGEDRDWLLGLVRAARDSIDATSMAGRDATGRGFVDGGFWATGLARTYLEAQRDAIRTRQVQVRRLFI